MITGVPHICIYCSIVITGISSSISTCSTIIITASVTDETRISAILIMRTRWFTYYKTQILINKLFHPSRAKLTHSS